MMSYGSLFPATTGSWLVGRVTLPGVLGLAALAAAACGSNTRPAYIDDRTLDDDYDDEHRGDEHADAATPEQVIVLPPNSSDEGACETLVELPVVKPNFYFVIDASGSMLEPMPGETVSRYQSASFAIESMLSGVQSRVNFGAALFPNPLDGASCNAGAEVFSLSNREHSKQGTTLDALLGTLSQYVPEGGSPVSSTLAAIQPVLLSLDGPTYVFLLSDGAPNCNLYVNCGPEECIPNIEGLSFEGGITCDETTNCCQPGWLPHLCLDEDATNQELGALADADVPTYVIGMPGSGTYSDVLGRMAMAGGTEREGEELLYYQINDAAELGATLISLGEEILVDCKLALDFAPTFPELVHVYAGDEEISTDGWEITDDQTIELLGETCEQWKAGELPEVRVRQTCTAPLR
jgi:hypothetical protein